MKGKLHNNWIVIGSPETSGGGYKVTMRSSGNNPKEVASDIAIMLRFALAYERVEFKGDNPVVEVDFSTSTQFEKFSKKWYGVK